MVEMVYFSEYFLNWKMIISFSELFSATCFLCILQTQLTRRNTSIPGKLKKRQRMTFMMTKITFANFFYQDLFHIYNILYVQSFI